MIARATYTVGNRLKAQAGEIEFINEKINQSNSTLFRYKIIEVLREQR
jgi:hypothetical protein